MQTMDLNFNASRFQKQENGRKFASPVLKILSRLKSTKGDTG